MIRSTRWGNRLLASFGAAYNGERLGFALLDYLQTLETALKRCRCYRVLDPIPLISGSSTGGTHATTRTLPAAPDKRDVDRSSLAGPISPLGTGR